MRWAVTTFKKKEDKMKALVMTVLLSTLLSAGVVLGPGGAQGGHIEPGDWPMGPGHGGGMR
jgi:hypothetical protein